MWLLNLCHQLAYCHCFSRFPSAGSLGRSCRSVVRAFSYFSDENTDSRPEMQARFLANPTWKAAAEGGSVGAHVFPYCFSCIPRLISIPPVQSSQGARSRAAKCFFCIVSSLASPLWDQQFTQEIPISKPTSQINMPPVLKENIIFIGAQSLLNKWLCIQRLSVHFYWWCSRERKERREREKHIFVVPLIYSFIGCILCEPWLEIKPATLSFGDDAFTNEATLPGMSVIFKPLLTQCQPFIPSENELTSSLVVISGWLVFVHVNATAWCSIHSARLFHFAAILMLPVSHRCPGTRKPGTQAQQTKV